MRQEVFRRDPLPCLSGFDGSGDLNPRLGGGGGGGLVFMPRSSVGGGIVGGV